ncbi:MAG: SMC family ATPase [SAR202 cluster bacterium]|nr:SMC family ATPase [SAR202 cluster bacterium]
MSRSASRSVDRPSRPPRRTRETRRSGDSEPHSVKHRDPEKAHNEPQPDMKLSRGFGREAFLDHAAAMGDHSERGTTADNLQRAYGNRYVNRLADHIRGKQTAQNASRPAAAPATSTITPTPAQVTQPQPARRGQRFLRRPLETPRRGMGREPQPHRQGPGLGDNPRVAAENLCGVDWWQDNCSSLSHSPGALLIPLKLTVRNFMCYRDGAPTLDLQGIHVACLCGQNGHGKSALLDAITWVLWGKARADKQEELIHQGQEEMAVDLEFLSHDQRYRASRRYGPVGRGRQKATLLDLQVLEGDAVRPITGNTVRETEERIRDLLHLDYDTFVNTAFLLQGRADMFTRATPSQRKETLAEVLGLGYYQKLEERAKERARDLQEKVRDMDASIALTEQEVARKPQVEADLAAVAANLARIEPEAEAQKQKAEQAQQSVDALRVKVHEHAAVVRRLAEAQREVAELEKQARANQAKVIDFETVMKREPEVREGHALLQKTRAEAERLGEALSKKSRLDGERSRLEQEIAVRKAGLSAAAEQLRKRIADELEPRAHRLPQLEADLAALESERARLDALEGQVNAARATAAAMAADLERMDRAMVAMTSLDQKRTALEKEIAVQKERLAYQAGQLRKTVAGELEPRARRIPEIEKYISELVAQESGLSAVADSIRARRAEAEDASSKAKALHAANERLRHEMAETRKKFDMLDGGDLKCPLCKTDLGPEGQAHLRREFEALGRESKRQYQANEAEIKDHEKRHKELSEAIGKLEADLDGRRRFVQSAIAGAKQAQKESIDAAHKFAVTQADLVATEATIAQSDFAHKERARLATVHREISALGYDANARAALQRKARETADAIARQEGELNAGRQRAGIRLSKLETDLDACRAAAQQLPAARAEMEATQARIASGDFAHEERRQLGKLNEAVAALGYDAEKHREAQEQAKRLAEYDDLHRRLSDAVTNLNNLRDALAVITGSLKRRKEDAAQDEQRRLALDGELKALPGLEAELATARGLFQSTERRLQDARVQHRVLCKQLERIAALEGQLKAKQKVRKDLVDEKGVYDELTVAFGKNGIQALIIETAIPQLQDDANELLGRLTENRMFLKLQLAEGRKERRIGIASEELEIKISDEIGTRSYETFSGGEAFRINFALRIALSKLLARRSGAPLPILFIDEGFGSQDLEGQERLKEAIQSIQEEFQKIIVITHVEDIKEAFPVRIEVTKTPMGSTFAVV